MALLTAMIVTSALLMPVYYLANSPKTAEIRVSRYFNRLS